MNEFDPKQHDLANDDAEFDPALAAAMHPVDAPATLLPFLLRETAPKGRLLIMPAKQGWMSGAIAAVLVMGCALGGLHIQHQHEAARATADFELSQRITEQALAETRQQLQQQGISLDELERQ